MFCPRCGRNLVGDEVYCPECGNVLREETMTQTCTCECDPGNGSLSPYLFLIIGFVSMFAVTFLLGFYMFFLFIPLAFGGRRMSRTSQLFTGAMLGMLAGFACRFIF